MTTLYGTEYLGWVNIEGKYSHCNQSPTYWKDGGIFCSKCQDELTNDMVEKWWNIEKEKQN